MFLGLPTDVDPRLFLLVGSVDSRVFLGFGFDVDLVGATMSSCNVSDRYFLLLETGSS